MNTQTLPEWMQRASGYACDLPVEYQHQCESRIRACGHCPRCTARKKRDVAGRCAAEAYTSPEVVVWTLTYRDGEPGALDFVTDDRQRWLKRVRDWLYRKARAEVGAPKRYRGASAHVRAYYKARIAEVLPLVRYMGCGERGKRSTKRCHWHAVLFLSRASGFVSTPRQSDGKPGRENHDLWPHGFVNIHVLSDDMGRKMQAVRYAVKYLDKARVPSKAAQRRGEVAEARFFRSLATPLGFYYLTDVARQHAQAGLPLRGEYRIPGVRFSRGRDGRPPDLVKHVVSGRMRDHYIAAYRAEWDRLRPDRPVPMNEFLQRFDSEGEAQTSPQARVKAAAWFKSLPDLQTLPPLPVVPKRDRSGVLAVDVPGKGNVGLVRVLPSGYAEWIAKDGTIWPVPDGHLRDVLQADDTLHARVADWLTDRRGPDWVSPRELRELRLQRHFEQREAIERWAKRAPGIQPEWVQGASRPVTALFRKLAVNGNGHVPGAVVYDPHAKPDPETGKKPGFVRGGSLLRKPIHMREA